MADILGLIIIAFGAAWVYAAPPGFTSALVWVPAGLVVLGLAGAWQERICRLIGLIIVVLIGPLVLALLIGLSNYLRLDTASLNTEARWNPSDSSTSVRPLLIHVSDTHFIDGTQEVGATRQGDKWDVQLLRKMRDRIINLHPQYLIVSGDITDLGSQSGWDRASSEFLSPVAQAGITVVMAPGNHDIQPFFAPHPDDDQFGRPQLNLFLREASKLGVNSKSAGGPMLDSLLAWNPPPDASEILKRYNDRLSSCSNNCGPGGDGPPKLGRLCEAGCRGSAGEELKGKGPLTYAEYTTDACDTWYPMTHFDTTAHVAFIVLCSVEQVATRSGTNAVGTLGDRQIKAFRNALAAVPANTRRIFVVLHHPVVKRENDRYGLPRRFTSLSAILSSPAAEFAFLPQLLSEAHEVVSVLRHTAAVRPDATLYLLFGHRHGRFQGKLAQAQGEGPWVGVSEAPAAFDPQGGMWIGYAQDSTAIEWRWRGTSDP